ncbi:MAG: hypothetical protein U5L72_16990 [Bacteroidales bacterium]|nr:hypothetical protein [Bacteroidales bacterium]
MSKASFKFVSLFILVLFIPDSHLSAAEIQDSKINPYMLFTYLKNTDSQQILQVKMTNITQSGEVPLPGLKIRFYNNETLLEEIVNLMQRAMQAALLTVHCSYSQAKTAHGLSAPRSQETV